MATLKNLLNNGLKVGALVKHEKSESIWQYINIKSAPHFQCILVGNPAAMLEKGEILSISKIQPLDMWQITTAYDCGITADELPLPESVDVTGWVVDSEGYKHQIEFIHSDTVEGNGPDIGPDYFEFTNGSYVLVSECRACLPPY